MLVVVFVSTCERAMPANARAKADEKKKQEDKRRLTALVAAGTKLKNFVTGKKVKKEEPPVGSQESASSFSVLPTVQVRDTTSISDSQPVLGDVGSSIGNPD